MRPVWIRFAGEIVGSNRQIGDTFTRSFDKMVIAVGTPTVPSTLDAH
jgi:hypothetical protein